MSRFLLPLAMTAVSASVLPRHPVAAPAPVPAPQGGSHVSFPIVQRAVYGGPSLRRRAADADSTTLFNYTNVAYMVELAIGTPSQKVRVQLDTGSNELWVDPDCSAVSGSASRKLCESTGVYDPSQSSTFVDGEVYNTLAYGKGQVDIDYVLDNIVVPGTNNAVLKQVTFGVAIASEDAAVPIMGVGFGNGYNTEYDNIIDELALQGVTNSRAFSVALGSIDGIAASTGVNKTEDPGDNISNGVVIFGGIDTKKFTGPLYKFQNLPPQASDTGRPWRYWIQLDSVGYTKPGASSSTTYSSSSLPIVLDTGSTLSFLPNRIVSAIAASVGVQQGSDGSIIVDCDLGDLGGSVDFTFGDLTIAIPLNDFIWDGGDGQCAIGALPASSTTALLGDTFMRSAYFLFDQEHQDIYLARVANCGTNEQTLDAAGNYNFTGECTEAKAKASAAVASLAPISLAALAALVGVQALFSLL